METVLNLIELCLTYVATVNFQLMAFKYSRKTSHIGTVRIYMSSVALSATSGKVEMHTLRTLVDVSLLFFFKLTVHLLSTCLVDINVCFCNLFKHNTIVKLVTSSA